MKKFFKENLVVIIIFCVFLLLIGGGIFFFVNNMMKSQEEIEEKVKIVDESYQVFSEDSSKVSELRTKIYNEVFNNVYYVDFTAKSESWNKNFDEYYKLIDNLHKNHAEVVNICNSYNFIYDSTKQKCSSILEYYEVLINNYVTDCNLYNSNIDKYNEWTVNNINYKSLEKYKSKGYTEYVDYNKNKEIEHY